MIKSALTNEKNMDLYLNIELFLRGGVATVKVKQTYGIVIWKILCFNFPLRVL